MADQMDKTFLYATAGVFGACAALCAAKPEDMAVETFGESAKTNKHLHHMYGPLAAIMGIQSLSALALAQGKDAATALFYSFSVIPFRMAYDVSLGAPPPKVMMAAVTGLWSFGLYNFMRKK